MSPALSLMLATILFSSFAEPIKDIHNNEMPVPYNFGIYPTSASTLRLIWDAPEVNEDNVIYYLHVMEMDDQPTEQDFCAHIMPGVHSMAGSTPEPRVTLSDGKSVPTPHTNRLSCALIPRGVQARGPADRKETCYSVKGTTQLVLNGLSSYERYRAKIQACYNTMLGLCSDTVSVMGRTLPEDPLNKIPLTKFVGEEPADTPGTIIKLAWLLPQDDSIRAFSVVLRINDRKAVMLCRSHSEIRRMNLTFEVLIVGPGQCHITAKAATHVGWHEWHDVGEFIPRIAKKKKVPTATLR